MMRLRPRVLVIEDKPSVLKVMATILESAYEVTTACDGPAALSAIGSSPIDVVLTDVRMPGASGFEVLRAVRERTPTTAVVMMTAYANVADAVTAIKLGAYDYVAKPIDADEIALVVARAVEHVREQAGHDCPAPQDDDRHTASEHAQEPSVGFHRAVEAARDRASRDYLVNLLQMFHGNVTEAAKEARMTRESLHRVLRKYGVRSEDHRGHAADGDRLVKGVAGGGVA
jgi:DNA-binding NtrC family response regulator